MLWVSLYQVSDSTELAVRRWVDGQHPPTEVLWHGSRADRP